MQSTTEHERGKNFSRDRERKVINKCTLSIDGLLGFSKKKLREKEHLKRRTIITVGWTNLKARWNLLTIVVLKVWSWTRGFLWSFQVIILKWYLPFSLSFSCEHTVEFFWKLVFCVIFQKTGCECKYENLLVLHSTSY